MSYLKFFIPLVCISSALSGCEISTSSDGQTNYEVIAEVAIAPGESRNMQLSSDLNINQLNYTNDSIDVDDIIYAIQSEHPNMFHSNLLHLSYGSCPNTIYSGQTCYLKIKNNNDDTPDNGTYHTLYENTEFSAHVVRQLAIASLPYRILNHQYSYSLNSNELRINLRYRYLGHGDYHTHRYYLAIDSSSMPNISTDNGCQTNIESLGASHKYDYIVTLDPRSGHTYCQVTFDQLDSGANIQGYLNYNQSNHLLWNQAKYSHFENTSSEFSPQIDLV